MTLKLDAHSIVNTLRERGVLDDTAQLSTNMTGTTEGLVYMITVNEQPKYVLKVDSPNHIYTVVQFYQTYLKSPLLPKLIYTDPAQLFIVYAFTPGTTHYNRGSKRDWLSRLVKDLLNHYEINDHTGKWGSLEWPCDSWREFNERSLEDTRNDLGDLLPNEDYLLVKQLIKRISEVDRPYLLHGDTGVHNFVFHESKLVSVIDPFPIIGPLIYDFTYAFCSSPDDIHVETLFDAYDLFNYKPVERSRLIEEVTLQLYCRIGICQKFHPHDMDEYLKAWEYWKARIDGPAWL
jgi:hypothetical protein